MLRARKDVGGRLLLNIYEAQWIGRLVMNMHEVGGGRQVVQRCLCMRPHTHVGPVVNTKGGGWRWGWCRRCTRRCSTWGGC